MIEEDGGARGPAGRVRARPHLPWAMLLGGTAGFALSASPAWGQMAALHEAAREGDLARVEALLAAGRWFAPEGCRGGLPNLHYAALLTLSDEAVGLVAAGADRIAPPAANGGDLPASAQRNLRASGYDVVVGWLRRGETPLHFAVLGSASEALSTPMGAGGVEKLAGSAQASASPGRRRHERGETWLDLAAAWADVPDMMAMLFDHGADARAPHRIASGGAEAFRSRRPTPHERNDAQAG